MKTKITLSGEVASGKTTVGKLLAGTLGYEFVSLGVRMRKRAEKEGLHITEFQKKCKENPLIDQEIDDDFSNFCNQKDSLVIDYRMGFKFVENAFHVFLRISEEDAVERLKSANRPDESFETVNERNESFKSQFLNSYQVDYTQEYHYDLVINVTNKTAEEIVQTIINYLNFKNNEKENYTSTDQW